MQQEPNYVLIMAGILFLTAAYCTLTDTAKHYEPASLYKEQFLMDRKVISTYKKTGPGQELNAEEPTRWLECGSWVVFFSFVQQQYITISSTARKMGDEFEN